MQIKIEPPPFYDEIIKILKPGPTTVFTYADIIYNPANVPISDHLMEHEKTHSKQHQHNETIAKLWWERYLRDKEFRVEEEVEAYGAQYLYICQNVIKDRNQRFKVLNDLANMLSGPMYGNIIGTFEAIRKIRKASGVDKLSSKYIPKVG